ncbi:unnamed protein product [marine sediment metagenome]|uniref:Uncharacterized protein n=1 Tax=marine sediment metagenome TaxID=412755 RepID=X0UEW5_9ZZZZ
MAIYETLTEKAWALHRRLGASYNHTSEYLKDMIKLGEIAKDIEVIRSASHIEMKYNTK